MGALAIAMAFFLGFLAMVYLPRPSIKQSQFQTQDFKPIGEAWVLNDASLLYQLRLADNPHSWCGEIRVIPYMVTCYDAAIPFFTTNIVGFHFCGKHGWIHGLNFGVRYTRARKIINIVRISMRSTLFNKFRSLELIQLFKDQGYKFHSRIYTGAIDEVVMYDPLDSEALIREEAIEFR